MLGLVFLLLALYFHQLNTSLFFHFQSTSNRTSQHDRAAFLPVFFDLLRQIMPVTISILCFLLALFPSAWAIG